jgi:hypothetical protein
MTEYAELMAERQKILADALYRAEAGMASWEDWNILRAELGMPIVPKINFENEVKYDSE